MEGSGEFDAPFEMKHFGENLDDVVGDGCVLEGDRKLAIFPLISTCIPLVIQDSDGKIVECIHADKDWNPERIKEELKRHNKGILKVVFAERTAKDEVIAEMLKNAEERENLLKWLNEQATSEGIVTQRTLLPAQHHLQHIGYLKGKGFTNITLTGK